MPQNTVNQRIVGIVAVFLLAQLALGLWVSNHFVTDFTKLVTEDQLHHASRMAKQMLDLRRKNLHRQGELLRLMPPLIQGIANKDLNLIRSNVERHQIELELPIFDIFDHKGQLLLRQGEDLNLDLVLQKMVFHTLETGLTLSSFAQQSGRLTLLSSVLVGPTTQPIGVIVLGFPLDQSFTLRMKELSEAEITLMAGGQVFSSTIKNAERQALMGRLPTKWVEQDQVVADLWPGYLLMNLPLFDFEGNLTAHMVVQISLDQAETLLSNLQIWGGVSGLFILLISIVLSSFYLRKILFYPVRSIIKVINRIEATNDLTQRITVNQNDEIGRIGKAFNRLMDRQEQAVKELTDSEEENRKLSLAVAQSPVTIMISDFHGNIEYVNPHFTRLTGYKPDEILGKNPNFLASGQSPPSLYKELWTQIKSGNIWVGEFVNKTKSGAIFTEAATISPIFDEAGNITHFLAIKEDISLKKQVENDLIQAKLDAQAANRAKSEFLANMSHEIRTPMNAILAMTSLILDSDLTEEQAEMMSIVNHSTENLLAVINDILDLSKIESGRMDLFNRHFSLAHELNELLDLFKPKCAEKGLALTLEVPPNLPEPVFGDPVRVKQVLMNLIGNALKFTHHGSVKVQIIERYQKSGQTVFEFIVADTGVGIAPDRIRRIFESFTQGESATTKRYGGTGLGLTISKKLVDLMGGEIGVDSTLGQGSRFYFSLPFGLTINGQEESQKARSHTKMLAGRRILLVEDNLVNQQVTSKVLTSDQAVVEVADNGKEALEKLKNTSFELVLMDMQMPVMNGLEATRLIRQGEAGDPNIPIIALTANAFESDRERCLAAGMNDFIAKPFHKVHLFDMINHYLPVIPSKDSQ